MPKTTWARAARRIASDRAFASATRSRCMASALSIGGDGAARPRASRAAQGADRALPAGDCSPSISPGRRMTASISTIFCRCPTRRRRSTASSAMSTRCRRAQRADAARESVHLCAFEESDDERDRFSARDRRPHRLRPAARRQQRLSSRRSTTASIPRPISTAFPCEHVGEIHLAGHAERSRRGRRAAADRRAWHAGRRCRSGRSTQRALPRTAGADADRMGQRRAAFAVLAAEAERAEAHHDRRGHAPRTAARRMPMRQREPLCRPTWKRRMSSQTLCWIQRRRCRERHGRGDPPGGPALCRLSQQRRR